MSRVQQINKMKQMVFHTLLKLERMHVDVNEYLDELKNEFQNNVIVPLDIPAQHENEMYNEPYESSVSKSMDYQRMIAPKSNIKWKYILLTDGYIKEYAPIFIAQDICNLILFYFAKPLKLELRCNYLSASRHILYCPVDDNWDSMINNIQQQFNCVFINALKYNDQHIDEYVWMNFIWNESQAFTIQFDSKDGEYNYMLLISEEQYVNELEIIVQYIAKPLEKSAVCGTISGGIDSVKTVFKYLNSMCQFHTTFLSVVRDEPSVLPDFYKYIGFIQMYDDYLAKYDQIIEMFSSWNSIEVRDFIMMRLTHKKVKNVIDNQLCSVPWYLYRPMDRIKEYYRWLKDLTKFSDCEETSSDDSSTIQKAKAKVKVLYRKIKQSEERLMQKTRLSEIQLKIRGYPEQLVKNGRVFVNTSICQMKRIETQKYKFVEIYLFNDMLIWTSKKFNYKGKYNFTEVDLKIFVPKHMEYDGVFSIVLKDNERLIKCANNEKRDKLMNLINKTYKAFLSR